jgi:hypothetical protein
MDPPHGQARLFAASALVFDPAPVQETIDYEINDLPNGRYCNHFFVGFAAVKSRSDGYVARVHRFRFRRSLSRARGDE